jgi:hypothetical protein
VRRIAPEGEAPVPRARFTERNRIQRDTVRTSQNYTANHVGLS